MACIQPQVRLYPVFYLAIFESFEKEGIDFAYPTQQLYIGGKTTSSLVQTLAEEAT